MERLRQPVATGGNGFRHFRGLRADPFATDYHPLQPQGSIHPPTFVVSIGDIALAQ